MIILGWREGGWKGYREVLPDHFFKNTQKVEYDILLPSRQIVVCRCSVSVAENIVSLDYGGKHSSFNKKSLIDTGKSKLSFSTPTLDELVKYEWQPPGEILFEVDVELYLLDRIFGDEGNPKLAAHIQRERKQHLVRDKIDLMRASREPIICEACKFDFAKAYPKLGSDFCGVHHRKGLAGGTQRVGLPDLALLCANCHRMIHRTGDPMLSVAKFASCHVKISNSTTPDVRPN